MAGNCLVVHVVTKLGFDYDLNAPFVGLPRHIYDNGLTPKLEAQWDILLEQEGRLSWTGVWPCDAEAIEFGFYCKWRPGAGGWTRCDKDDPEARPDLNRLCAECVWDREKKRMVLRDSK